MVLVKDGREQEVERAITGSSCLRMVRSSKEQQRHFSVGLVFSRSANRYPAGVFEKLDRWFPADDVSKLNPSPNHKKRTVEALNGVITLSQVTTFCNRRLYLSRKNESMV
jgi:hypothetical protein